MSEWLKKILEETEERAAGRPDWARSDYAKRELAKLADRRSDSTIAIGKGKLVYSFDEKAGYKLVAEVDPQIAHLARKLIPKRLDVHPQKFAPHITLVRNEPAFNLERWGEHQGATYSFAYDTRLKTDDVYFWYDCWSPMFLAIREELDLPISTELTRPPDGSECFHLTVGNRKHLKGLK